MKLLVTGATGTVGRALLDHLAGRRSGGAAPGATVRAAVRVPGSLQGPADEVVRFEFTDPGTYRAAFADVDAMFLVRPPAISRVRRDLVPALEAAVEAGVERVVFLSVLGADRNRLVPHARIESWLAGADVDATFLRASFFMQNLFTEHREEIRSGELFVPAGAGETSFVDARDVAAVSAALLLPGGRPAADGSGSVSTMLEEPSEVGPAVDDPTGEARAYDLTGPEALDYATVARILSRELGWEVRYANPSVLRFLWRRSRDGTGLGKAGIMAGIYTTARLGLAGRVTDDVRQVLGREPCDLATFVREHRDRWHQ